MKTFEVHFKSHDTFECETREEAVKLFKDKYPHPHLEPTNFYECGEGIPNEVIGCCEDCEKPIFEDQEFDHDSEGVMWHKKCVEEES